MSLHAHLLEYRVPDGGSGEQNTLAQQGGYVYAYLNNVLRCVGKGFGMDDATTHVIFTGTIALFRQDPLSPGSNALLDMLTTVQSEHLLDGYTNWSQLVACGIPTHPAERREWARRRLAAYLGEDIGADNSAADTTNNIHATLAVLHATQAKHTTHPL